MWKGCMIDVHTSGNLGNHLMRTSTFYTINLLSPVALLEPHEEEVLRKYYEKRLLEFCSAFKPIMPKSVMRPMSAIHFGRAVEDSFPHQLRQHFGHIFRSTCTFGAFRLTSVYLACKVDEFNVSSSQYVANLWESPAGQEKALEQILEYELLLIQQLNFHLIVHNPFRPFEGFLIDLKTRYTAIENPEVLRKTADEFLSRATMTDAGLLFTPSQIAIAAIHFSASRAGINMDSYLTECLMLKDTNECLSKLIEGIRCIKNLVKKYDPPKPEEVILLKQKLEHLHCLDLGISTSLKKRKGYEEDGTISKKAKVEEEEWSDDDLIDAM
ncbi:cyclin-H isoform X2 [Scyliorhinus canicula]|uniref:cyclin-H isoform X2 n=1 Tax=Scyliorhinus canicula TaxID=7830 RepID=UPI0018F4A118|nr:cyclin-H isoform X2 [Scyliorhinus canicula]